ncbi:MAG: hypothetical protein FJ008_08860 [Chloroflexi bacterium]|nr:hypothetical protein [Chloroflexota bacterium]
MSLNVSCAIPNCTNPVVGQCAGYKGSCGRFYCAAHSTDRLCADCARRKSEDEIAQRTYEDYLHTAEQLRRELGSAFLPIFIGAVVVSVMLGLAISQSNFGVGLTVMCAGMIAVGIWGSDRTAKQEKVRLEEISKTKPAFPEFYKTWKKEKNKEALMTGLAIAGVIVAGAIAAAASDSREKRVSEIEEGVRRAMR